MLPLDTTNTLRSLISSESYSQFKNRVNILSTIASERVPVELKIALWVLNNRDQFYTTDCFLLLRLERTLQKLDKTCKVPHLKEAIEKVFTNPNCQFIFGFTEDTNKDLCPKMSLQERGYVHYFCGLFENAETFLNLFPIKDRTFDNLEPIFLFFEDLKTISKCEQSFGSIMVNLIETIAPKEGRVAAAAKVFPALSKLVTDDHELPGLIETLSSLSMESRSNPDNISKSLQQNRRNAQPFFAAHHSEVI